MSTQESTYQYILETRDLAIGYHGKNKKSVVLSGIDIHIHKGEIVCLLGPNGSGKSTLIRTLAGMQPALNGQILINNLSLEKSNISDLATQLGVVLTDRVEVGELSVSNVVAMGRFPYTNWYGKLNFSDIRIIKSALENVDLLHYADRPFSQLSDGEKQRVLIAKALAQDTPLIMLDEPTAHLDLPNRVEIMKLLRELAHKTLKSILLSTHELDLALQIADRIWLMNGHDEIITGTPEDLVLNGSFENAFKKQSFDFNRTTGTFNINYVKNKPIRLSGDSTLVFWTRRAVERYGFKVSDAESHCSVLAQDEVWTVDVNNKSVRCKSIIELLQVLSLEY